MKIIDTKQGRPIAYISQDDLEVLLSNGQFVSEELFREESILKGECTSNGYYPIVQEQNVRYVQGLPFILDYNHLLKFDSTELSEMMDNAQDEYDKMERLLMVPCDTYVSLDQTQRDSLRAITGLYSNTIDEFASLNVQDEESWLKAYDMAAYIRMQHEHYSASLYRMYEYRMEHPLKPAKKPGKLFRLVRKAFKDVNF